MNKLEQEIEFELNTRFKGSNFTETVRRIQFEEGVQFILEKNLDEQFAEYIGKNKYEYQNGKWCKLSKIYPFQSECKTTSELKQYWINNVYGL